MTRVICISVLTVLLTACLPDLPAGPWPPLKTLEIPTNNYVKRWPSDVIKGVVTDDMLVVSDGYGVFSSDDKGLTWRELELPAEIQVLEIALSSESREMVIIDNTGTVHQSFDGGSTFKTRNVYQSLPLDMDELALSWESFSLDHAQISDDFKHWVLVGFCEAFVSHDGAKTWQRVTGNEELGSWDHYDLCLSELFVDGQYEPQFAAVDVTGTLASGEYIFANADGRWKNVCSFDTVAYLLESVRHCEDSEDVIAHPSLSIRAGGYVSPWTKSTGEDSGIFERHHYPLTADANVGQMPNLMQNAAGELWNISYLGVAFSEDRGERWTTLIGGIPIAERQTLLAANEWVALWDDRVYLSVDDNVWQRDLNIDYAYDFLGLTNSALVATESGVIRYSAGGNSSTVLDRQTYKLSANAEYVWALGSESIAVSTNQGQSWQQHSSELSGEDWLCALVCVGVDYQGRIWEASMDNSRLTIEVIGALPEATEAYDFFHTSWAAADLSLLIVQVINSDNDQQTLWASSDRGRSFLLFPNPVEYIDHVLFPAPGTALLEGAQMAHWIRDGGEMMSSERSPMPTDAGTACTLDSGYIVFETWDVHPNWPDEEREYAIYSNDLGASWWTMPVEDSVCPNNR